MNSPRKIGITAVDVLAISEDWHLWELPDDLLGVALKGRYRGQLQRWVLARFTGSDSDVDISGRFGRKPEFTDWMWSERTDVVDLAVAHKRALYRHVLSEFEPVIAAQADPTTVAPAKPHGVLVG